MDEPSNNRTHVVLAALVAAPLFAGCSMLTSLDGLSESTAASERPDGSTTSAHADAGTLGRALPGDPRAGSDAGASVDGSIVDGAVPAPPLTCTGGNIACNGACVDPNGPAHCGTCGNTCSSGSCGASINESFAAAPVDWAFNGSAQFNSFAPSGELTLPSVSNQAGSIVYARPIVVDAFDVGFQFRIGLQGGTRSDGMGFVLQTDGAAGLGGSGGGLGMTGLSGFGVEFDIHDNATCGDTNGNHVGVDALTLCNGSEGTPAALFASDDLSASVDLADTHWHTAHVILASGAITVTLDGATVASNVGLPGLKTGDAYYFGFTGATGGLVSSGGTPGGFRQEVKNVTVTFPTPRCL